MITTLEKIELRPGVTLRAFQTPAFKTTTIKLFIHLPLDESATANALLVRVLGRGSRKYPTMRKMNILMDSLYGAMFGADVMKIGERHVIELFFEFVSRRYLPKNTDNTRSALKFLKEIVFQPLLQKGVFRPDYFAQEQINLKDLIKSVYDDKMSYADERCVQEMCAGEPYRIYDYGDMESADKLTPAGLWAHYHDKVLKAPMDIYVCGPHGPDKIARMVADIFKLPGRKPKFPARLVIPDTIVNKEVTKDRVVTERQAIDQGKLVIGCRTYTTWADPDIFSLMMASAILGGFPHSKLFRNVREKAGLAYYASSMLEKSKGLMFIRAGINHDKFEAAVKIIKEQLEAMKAGDITDEEISSTRSGILDRLKGIEDNASSYIDYSLELDISKRSEPVSELKRHFQNITRDDIMAASRKIKIDTTYFLTK